MLPFIIAIVMLAIGVGGFLFARGATRALADVPDDDYRAQTRRENITLSRNLGRIVGGVGLGLTVLFLSFATVFTQGVGEAKVIVNVDGTIAGEKLDPGFGIKAPWQDTVDFDLFSQEALFAGNGEGTPSYSGGTVTGYEITSAVARGAQTNFDLSVVYSLDAEVVTEIYSEFRNQERFTKQVIEKTILSVARDIPTAYTPVEFRGDKRGEATDRMLAALDERLSVYGVQVDLVNLQNVRYTDEVETSIKSVEVAQQKEEEAAANLRATEISAQAQIVEAEARAQAEIAAAQGTAEANRLLTQSLTPEVLTNKYLEAIKNGTTFVVPEGSTPFVQVQK